MTDTRSGTSSSAMATTATAAKRWGYGHIANRIAEPIGPVHILVKPGGDAGRIVVRYGLLAIARRQQLSNNY